MIDEKTKEIIRNIKIVKNEEKVEKDYRPIDLLRAIAESDEMIEDDE